MNNYIKKKYNIIMLSICIFIIIFIISYRFSDKPGLWFGDEFGYFASAAYVSGFNWSSVISTQLGYFGIGYGIFLIPGFLFCKSAEELMIYTVVLNISFICISFFLCLRLLWGITNKKNFNICCITSMVVTLYINNLVQVQMGWSESINVLLYWLILNTFYDVIKKSKTINYVLFSLTLCYAVIVHMRNSLLAIAGVIIILLYVIKEKKIDYKKILIFGIVATFGAIVFFISKSLIQDLVWVAGDKVLINDVASSVSNFQNVGKYTSLSDLTNSLLAKLFYIISSTMGLIIYGCVYGFTQKKDYVFCLAFTGFSLEFLYTVYSMQIPTRYDAIFYGRYYEPFIGLLICYGILFFYDSCITNKRLLITGLILLTGYKICFLVASSMSDTAVSLGYTSGAIFPCMTGLAKYIFQNGISNVPVLAFTKSLRLMFIVYCIGTLYHVRRDVTLLRIPTLLTISAVVIYAWSMDAQFVINKIISFEEERYEEVSLVSNKLELIWDEDSTHIYYYTSGEYSDYILDLQLLTGKNSVENITSLSDICDPDSKKTYVVLSKIDSFYEKQKEEVLQIGNLLVETNKIAAFSLQ